MTSSAKPEALTPQSPTDPISLLGPFKGVIRQRTDPERLGRLKVTVAGFFEGIPVEDLPWIWPAQLAWENGGMFFIPPVGAVVWVDFENGDCEYGVWRQGWWGDKETSQGKGSAAHRQWPTSWFGGEARRDGILALEGTTTAKAEDAPDNFAITSPIQKRLELDDRKGREKILLADRHDNMLWMNTEDGVTTIEAVGGEQSSGFFPMGMTFSSKTGVQGIQAYTFGQWQMTMNDTVKTAELTSPRNCKIRLSDADKRLELWTTKGNKVVLDDNSDSVQILNSSGAGLFVKGGKATLSVGENVYLTMDLSSGEIVLKATGDFKLHAGGDMALTADGRITIDGTENVYLNSVPFVEPSSVPIDPVFTAPETLDRIPRACDYPYYV